jgi:hypothetical protein
VGGDTLLWAAGELPSATIVPKLVPKGT